MTEKNICLSNYMSESLNALLYIYSVYEIKEVGYNQIGVFPSFNFGSEGFLELNHFKETFCLNWNQIIKGYSNDVSFNMSNDLKVNYYHYIEKLFENNPVGKEVCNEVMASYLGWWWSYPPGGKVILESISGNYIYEIGRNLSLPNKGKEYATRHEFYLMMVYRLLPLHLPIDLLASTENLQIVSLDYFVPIAKTNEIVENLKATINNYK